AILSNLGIDLAGARIADGSGLSRHNAISPRQLGQVLIACADNPDYVYSFARVGVDGTVRNMMRNVPGCECFVLKSGSMTGVICYVGYLLDRQSRKPTHAIAIMINNAPDTKAARAAISNFLSSLISEI
ncbi:MAG: D-alanyl-D-alanine carboxypeptidase, partial [Muribaculaceae bacterium]|nr:D-alanyl-D-alanine carboxypeptidase [Muribaculaceae bacterium]